MSDSDRKLLDRGRCQTVGRLLRYYADNYRVRLQGILTLVETDADGAPWPRGGHADASDSMMVESEMVFKSLQRTAQQCVHLAQTARDFFAPLSTAAQLEHSEINDVCTGCWRNLAAVLTAVSAQLKNRDVVKRNVDDRTFFQQEIGALKRLVEEMDYLEQYGSQLAEHGGPSTEEVRDFEKRYWPGVPAKSSDPNIVQTLTLRQIGLLIGKEKTTLASHKPFKKALGKQFDGAGRNGFTFEYSRICDAVKTVFSITLPSSFDEALKRLSEKSIPSSR